MKEEIKSFEDLECFKQCKALRQKVSKLVKTFPTAEQYRLTDQLLRCSRSTTNNIAEGYERNGNKEFRNFLFIAKGSCAEVRSMLYLALEFKYITYTNISCNYYYG